jgi:hypothetical protein
MAHKILCEGAAVTVFDVTVSTQMQNARHQVQCIFVRSTTTDGLNNSGMAMLRVSKKYLNLKHI